MLSCTNPYLFNCRKPIGCTNILSPADLVHEYEDVGECETKEISNVHLQQCPGYIPSTCQSQPPDANKYTNVLNKI